MLSGKAGADAILLVQRILKVDVQVVGLERLYLSIALRVGEQILRVPHRLLGESARTVIIVVLAHVSATGRLAETSEGGDILLSNILKVQVFCIHFSLLFISPPPLMC
jgi:hypothetical protein